MQPVQRKKAGKARSSSGLPGGLLCVLPPGTLSAPVFRLQREPADDERAFTG